MQLRIEPGAGCPTPGLRPATDAHVRAQRVAVLGDMLPDGVGRVQLMRAVESAIPLLDLHPSAARYLTQTLALTRDCDWDGCQNPVVWRSLRHAAQANAVSTRTVQRWETMLMEAGLVSWADNGSRRRFGRRHPDGTIDYAFGLDLAPLADRYEELRGIGDRHRAECDAWNAANRRLGQARGRVRSLGRRLGRDPSEALVHKYGLATPAAELDALSEELEREFEAMSAEVVEAAACGGGPAPESPVDNHVDNCGAGDAGMHEQDANMSRGRDADVTHIYLQKHPDSLTGNTCTDRGGVGSGRGAAGHDGGAAAEKAGRGGVVGVGVEVAVPDTGIAHVKPVMILAMADPVLRRCLPVGRAPDWDDVIAAARIRGREACVGRWAWNLGVRRIGPAATAVCVLIADLRSRDPDPGRRVREPGAFLVGCIRRAARDELHLHRSVFGLLRRAEGALQ